MLSTVPAVILILVTWSLLGALAVGYGRLGAHILGRPGPTPPLAENFWLGICAFFFSAQIFHLFLPMQGAPLLILIAPALAGLALRHDEWPAHLRTLGSRRAACALTLLIGAGLAYRALRPGDHIDSVVYQYNAVRWLHDYPIVPGLVNLHERLGFNSVTLLLNAVLESTLWSGASGHIVNGFWFFAILASAIHATSRLADAHEPADLFSTVTIVPIVALSLTTNIASPTTDPPANCIALAMFTFALRALASHSFEERARISGVVTLLAVLTAAAKLSQLALAAPVALIVLAFAAKRAHTLRTLPFPAITAAIGLALIWSLRSIILTGYPLYPSTLLGLPVDWRPPVGYPELSRVMIFLDSHLIHDPLAPAPTFGAWSARWLRSQLTPLNATLGVLPLIASIALLPIVAIRRRARSRVLLLLIPCAIAAPVWFVSAPHSRFAAPIAWSALGVLFVALAMSSRSPRVIFALALSVWAACTALPIAALRYKPWSDPAITPDAPRGTARPSLLLPPPAPASRTFSGPLGTHLVLPEVGAKGCADSLLPATPFLNRGVVLRSPPDLSRGFRVSQAPRPAPDDEQLRAAAAFIAAKAKPSDRVLLLGRDRAHWDSLVQRGAPPLETFGGKIDITDARTAASAIAPAVKGGRYWVVIVDDAPDGGMDLTMPLTYFADHCGDRLAQLDLASISVYLYNSR